MMKVLLLSILYLLSFVWIASSYDNEIYIDPNHPNSVNNSTCYNTTHSREYPCKDINFALEFPGRDSSTIFYLSSSATHNLTNNATNNLFTGSSELAFAGDNGTAIVECEDEAGLAFINSTNINITRVEFLRCGAWRESTSINFTTGELLSIRVGLYFYNSRNVILSNMSVSNSSEAVGVVMYSVAGDNYIGYSHFDYNAIEKSNVSGGGGFAVEFNYCKPGDNNCSDSNHQTQNNRNSMYHFEHCRFNHNRALDRSGEGQVGTSILPFNRTHFSLGRGGGLSLYFKGESSENSIAIDNCSFTRNHANWGGGLCVQFTDRSIQNVVNVSNSLFLTNHCYFRDRNSSGQTGGGVLVSSPVRYDSKRDNYTRNEITFCHCNFTENRAVTGGALAFVYTLQRLSHHNQIFRANIFNSYFFENQARLGSAISIDHEYFYNEGLLGDMYISDSVFHNNTIVYTDTKKAYSLGIGAIYISEVPVTFRNKIEIWNSTGTGLALVGTRISFEANSIINFTSNYGASGGAIALLGVSSMLIGENTSMLFENNQASQFGGAIFNSYTGKEDLRSSVKCFLRYYDPFATPDVWNAQFVFKNNSAGKLGNSIFSTTILPCSLSNDPDAPLEITQNIFCWNETIWVYEKSNCSSQIYTSPQHFTGLSVTDKVYPGHPFKLNITAKDDLNHDVTIDTIYTASIESADVAAEIDPQYAYVANGSLAINGEVSEKEITLQLDVTGNRDWRIEVELTVEKCPIGFKLESTSSNKSNGTSSDKQNRCQCIGGDRLYTFAGNLICDEANMISKIRNGYWAGYVPEISNDTLYMGTTRLLVWNIPDNYLVLNNSQCTHSNRNGSLCGECIKNYSTAVNSYNYECVKCTKEDTPIVRNILAYVALSYLPYLALFLLILCFNLNLMSGPLIGFILYAQLVGSGVIELTIDRLPFTKNSNATLFFQKSYRVIYGVFNLNSFSVILNPFCISENFSALQVISLDYAVAVFPLILIIVIRLAVGLKDRCNFRRKDPNYSSLTTEYSSTGGRVRQKIKQFFSPNFVHAFVGFIYFSYTKMSLAAMLTLTTTTLLDINGSYMNSPRLIYYAGQYLFGHRDYLLPYGLLAMLVYAACIVLPFALLGGLDFVNWFLGLERLSKSKCARLCDLWPSTKINHFLEAMQDCYRPKRRYFAGVYFLFRLILLTIYAFSSDLLTQVLCQLFMIILLLVIIAILLPYKKMRYNVIDILLLTNMAAITLISIYLHSAPSYNIRSTYPIQLYTFGGVLIWVPMLYLLLYLCTLVLQKTQCFRNFVENLPNNRAVKFVRSHFSNLDVYVERKSSRLLSDPTSSEPSDKDDTDSLMLLIQSEQQNPLSESASARSNGHAHSNRRKRRTKKKRVPATQSVVIEVNDMSGTAEVQYGGTNCEGRGQVGVA